jgi:endonuclease YncB( thermonuclease family)
MKLVLSSVLIGLVLVGSISIQDGRGLFPDMGRTINLISSNTNSTGNFSTKCQGKADCFNGTVTEVVDGDTLDVNKVRIRLALIDAPEKNESGHSEARHFVDSLCKVGTQAKVDEDDRQKGVHSEG